MSDETDYPDMEGFDQCELCDGYFDEADLSHGICSDCDSDFDDALS